MLGLLLITSKTLNGQSVKACNFKQLSKLIHATTDSITVVNFWATWCKPCVQELPAFDSLYLKLKNKPVRFIMVSLDSEDDLYTQVLPFVKRKKFHFITWLLTDPDYNQWISKVEPTWDGTIPITLVYSHSKRQELFVKGKIGKLELQNKLEKILNEKAK